MTKAVIFGDSLLRGVTWDDDQARYKIWPNRFLPRLKALGVEIDNRSLFGCTAPRGETILQKALANNLTADLAFIEYGGNDSDFRWPEISADPEGQHQPLTGLAEYRESCRRMATLLRQASIEPVFCLLPPIDAEKYFAWFSRELDPAALKAWLADIRNIYRHQELYSLILGELARELDCRVVNLRAPLLFHRDYRDLLCPDGLHPRPAGYELMWAEMEKFFQTAS